MTINLEYLSPLAIKALYDAASTALDESDDTAEELELHTIMEQLNDAYIGLTGEAL